MLTQTPLATDTVSEAAPTPVSPASQGQANIDVPAQGGAMEEDVMQKASYEPFTQAAYDQAVANGEPIFLFFYASWCPFCQEQEPRNQEVFAGYGKFVRGFRVNYKDSDTDASETAMAAAFKVTYQHTAVYLKNGTDEVKRTVGTESNDSLVKNLDLIAR